MKCPSCRKEVSGNFCSYCGKKLSKVCKECWMKNGQPYNCGFEKCPGYKLPILEKHNKEAAPEVEAKK